MVVALGRAAGGMRPAGTAVLDRHGSYLELDETAGRLLRLDAEESLGSASFARIPADADEVWWLEERPEVTLVPLACRLVRGPDGGQWRLSMTESAGEFRDRETVRRYAQWAVGAGAHRDLDSIVQTLARELDTLCGFTGGLIVLIDEGSGEPVFAGGIPREFLAAMEECRRLGAPMVTWQAFTENRVVVKREWLTHVRQDPRLAPIRPFVEVTHDHDWSFVAMPLRYAGTRIGVLTGTVRDATMITPDAVNLWCDLADQTALALRYAEAVRAARASGSERERHRLNEELHDTVGQDVFALKMLAARAEVVALRESAPDVAGLVSELRTLADTVDSGVRALIGERRRVGPVLSLSEQLTGLAREVGSRSSIDIEAVVSDQWDHLSAECGETVVRIAAEALHNIEKHAQASTASLRVTTDEAARGMLLIEVADDGERFDPDAVSSASFGLTFIRERAAEYDGSVEVRTVPRTTLRVRLRPRFESEWDAAIHG